MTRIPLENLEKDSEIHKILKMSPAKFIHDYIFKIIPPAYNDTDENNPNKYSKIGKLVVTIIMSTGMGWMEIKYDGEIVCSTHVSGFFFNYGDWMLEYLTYLSDNKLIEEKYTNPTYNNNYFSTTYSGLQGG